MPALNTGINILAFYLMWPLAVFGAAYGVLWPAALLLVAFAVWQLAPSRRVVGDLRILPIAVLVGLFLDSLWTQIGFLTFATSWPSPSLAPVWILMLWAAMALTFNHGLLWFRRHLVLAGLLAAVGSPLSYYLGARIGAVTWDADMLTVAIALGLSWAVIFPALIHQARPKQATGGAA